MHYPVVTEQILEGSQALKSIQARLERGLWVIELGSGEYEFTSVTRAISEPEALVVTSSK